MRDLVAGLVAILLVMFALRLATSLMKDRRRRRGQRESLVAAGRTILAEIPADTGLIFFTEDSRAFYLADREIPKATIRAARVLINGAPIAVAAAPGYPEAAAIPNAVIEDRPDGISRDRWDVEIATTDGTVIVACGAIRERISQELARRVFEAVKGTMATAG